MVLELINETQIIILMYIGLSSSAAAIAGSPDIQWIIGYIAVGQSGFIIAVNLFLMMKYGFR